MLGFCLGLIKYVVLTRICFIDFRKKIIKDRDLMILLVIGILRKIILKRCIWDGVRFRCRY